MPRLFKKLYMGEDMKICQNKNTGQFFIHVDDVSPDKRLLVTPEGQVKSLQADLFSDPFEADEVDFRDKHLVTDEQLQMHRIIEKST
jgi:hypothetical protein